MIKPMEIGKLTFRPIAENYGLVAAPIKKSLQDSDIADLVFVARINPELANTASFCKEYGVGVAIATNCLVVEARRADKTWYAACLILATDMADINGIIRRQLDAHKISFAPIGTALKLTHMEYGGITPIGLPSDWPLLIDEGVMKKEIVVIGGGIRGSKIAVRTKALQLLPHAFVMKITKGA